MSGKRLSKAGVSDVFIPALSVVGCGREIGGRCGDCGDGEFGYICY